MTPISMSMACTYQVLPGTTHSRLANPLPLGQSTLYGRRLNFQQTTHVSSRSSSSLHVESRYRGIGTDRSKVAQFQRSENDVGSTEVQIAQLTARVEQLTTHLQQNRKDYAATRGLNILLGQRRRLLRYLYNTNRAKYEEILTTLGVRPLKAQAARGIMIKLRGDGAE
eukprot:jgi/Botrbrau1/17341/Bobra.0015s0087.2